MRRFALTVLLLAAATAAAACSREDSGTRTPDVTWLKKLHRGELSAMASYDDAKAKLPNLTAVDLSKIRADHADAADRLRGRIVALGGAPDATAGPWGDWAEAVTKAGAAFGEDGALRALQVGEKHGETEYEQALRATEVDADTKTMIRDVLLPRQREHATTLQSAIKSN